MKRVKRDEAARNKAARQQANEQAARDASRTPDHLVDWRPDVTEPGDDLVDETSDVPEGDVEQGRGRDYVEEEWGRQMEGQRPRHLSYDEVGGVSEHTVRQAGGGVRVSDMAPPGGPPRLEPITMAPEDMGIALLEDATQVGRREPIDSDEPDELARDLMPNEERWKMTDAQGTGKKATVVVDGTRIEVDPERGQMHISPEEDEKEDLERARTEAEQAEDLERDLVPMVEEEQPPLIITEEGEPIEPAVITEDGEVVTEEESRGPDPASW